MKYPKYSYLLLASSLLCTGGIYAMEGRDREQKQKFGRSALAQSAFPVDQSSETKDAAPKKKNITGRAAFAQSKAQ